MSFKFFYGNDAYKSSNPPDFSRLEIFLRYKFCHTTLPSHFTLHEISPDGSSGPVLTKKDYEQLQATRSEKPIKLRILESKDNKEEGRFGKSEFSEISEEISRIEEKKDEANLSDDASEVEDAFRELLDQLSPDKKEEFFQLGVHLDANKRRLLKEVLIEQAPFIVSKVKEAVNKELSELNLHEVDVNQAQKQEELQSPSKEISGLIGDFFKGALSKTGVLLDTLKQRVIGDPYVECSEGRYPKSVIEKGEILSEIFPDRDKKEILDFINEYESASSVDALADIFAAQKQ